MVLRNDLCNTDHAPGFASAALNNTKKIILWRDDYVFIFVKK